MDADDHRCRWREYHEFFDTKEQACNVAQMMIDAEIIRLKNVIWPAEEELKKLEQDRKEIICKRDRTD